MSVISCHFRASLVPCCIERADSRTESVATLSSHHTDPSASFALIARLCESWTYRTFEGSECLTERSLSAFVGVKVGFGL